MAADWTGIVSNLGIAAVGIVGIVTTTRSASRQLASQAEVEKKRTQAQADLAKAERDHQNKVKLRADRLDLYSRILELIRTFDDKIYMLVKHYDQEVSDPRDLETELQDLESELHLLVQQVRLIGDKSTGLMARNIAQNRTELLREILKAKSRNVSTSASAVTNLLTAMTADLEPDE